MLTDITLYVKTFAFFFIQAWGPSNFIDSAKQMIVPAVLSAIVICGMMMIVDRVQD